MQKYHNTLQETNGDIITTATVTVYLANTGTLATLYQDDEIATYNNPFTVSDANYDSKGAIFFKAVNGIYDIKVVNGASTTWIYDVSVADLGFGIQDDATSNAMTIDSNEDISYIGTAQYAVGEGVVFNGDAVAAANTLDDYEEGAWTPVITDLTNNATMHANNSGTYTKIGRLVTLTATVRTTSLGSVSGAVYISGFPFTIANTNGNNCAGSVANAENMNITAGYAVTLFGSKGGTTGRLDIFDDIGGITVLQSGEWSSDGQAIIGITYSI